MTGGDFTHRADKDLRSMEERFYLKNRHRPKEQTLLTGQAQAKEANFTHRTGIGYSSRLYSQDIHRLKEQILLTEQTQRSREGFTHRTGTGKRSTLLT